MRGGERGSATPFLALLVLAVGGLCLGLGHLTGVADASAKAQTAADAAALAGAADGPDAARDLAAANGAEVVRLDRDGDEVQVRVRVRTVEAVARAVREGGPDRVDGATGASATGLVPELKAALAAAGRLLGVDVPISSGWRSRARQQQLYDDRGTNPYPVAVPGTSSHERGKAVDVPKRFAGTLAAIGPQVGLCRPWPKTDPVHFELCRRTE